MTCPTCMQQYVYFSFHDGTDTWYFATAQLAWAIWIWAWSTHGLQAQPRHRHYYESATAQACKRSTISSQGQYATSFRTSRSKTITQADLLNVLSRSIYCSNALTSVKSYISHLIELRSVQISLLCAKIYMCEDVARQSNRGMPCKIRIEQMKVWDHNVSPLRLHC